MTDPFRTLTPGEAVCAAIQLTPYLRDSVRYYEWVAAAAIEASPELARLRASDEQINALLKAARTVHIRWVSGMPEYGREDIAEAVQELAEAIKPFEGL